MKIPTNVNLFQREAAMISDTLLIIESGSAPPPDDEIYRIRIFPLNGKVLVYCFGDIDNDIDGHYDSVDDLPVWMQERLAILMLMSCKPPTESIDDVGRRIGPHLFWVYK